MAKKLTIKTVSGTTTVIVPSKQDVSEQIKEESQLKSLVFNTQNELEQWILNGTIEHDGYLPSDLQIGQNLYTIPNDEPDFWVKSTPVTSMSNLEIIGSEIDGIIPSLPYAQLDTVNVDDEMYVYDGSSKKVTKDKLLSFRPHFNRYTVEYRDRPHFSGYPYTSFGGGATFNGRELYVQRSGKFHSSTSNPSDWGVIVMYERMEDGSFNPSIVDIDYASLDGEARDVNLSVSPDGKYLYLKFFTNAGVTGVYSGYLVVYDKTLTQVGFIKIVDNDDWVVWGNTLKTPNGYLLTASYTAISKPSKVGIYRSTAPVNDDYSSVTFEKVAEITQNDITESTLGYWRDKLVMVSRREYYSGNSLYYETSNLEGDSGWSSLENIGHIVYAPCIKPYNDEPALLVSGTLRVNSNLRQPMILARKWQGGWTNPSVIDKDMEDYGGYTSLVPNRYGYGIMYYDDTTPRTTLYFKDVNVDTYLPEYKKWLMDSENYINYINSKGFYRVRIFNDDNKLVSTQIIYEGEKLMKPNTEGFLYYYNTWDAFKYNDTIIKDIDLTQRTMIPPRYVQTTVEDFDSNGNYIGTEEYIILPAEKSSGYKITNINVKGVATNGDYLTNTSEMFRDNNSLYLELDYLNTSNVTDMSYMFRNSQSMDLDLNNFDTSNVTNMGQMLRNTQATTLNLSSFDTSNVTDMQSMFRESKATILDLSSFDTSNVTNMSQMFNNAQATIGYARTQTDADRFNSSSAKPASLTFIVK